MKPAVAAIGACCAVHAGVLGVAAGWSLGSWTAPVAVASVAAVLAVVVTAKRADAGDC